MGQTFIAAPLPRASAEQTSIRRADGGEARSFAPNSAPGEAVFPIAASGGGPGLAVRVNLQPLVRLGEARAVGVRVTRRVVGGGVELPLSRLDPADAARADAEAYGEGLALLARTETAAALIPIDFATLVGPEGRIAYLDACLKAPRLGPGGACPEIQGVGPEVTPHELAEVAVLLGRPADGVLIHVGRDGAVVERLHGERAVGGVCIDVSGVGVTEWARVSALVRRARTHASLCLLEGLEPAMAAQAVAAGATHAVFAPTEGARV